MAEAEYAGIGAFLTELGSAWKGRREEQKRKHDQWMSCIMGGISAEDCSRILGYDPGEEARGGAESIEARRGAETEAERARKLSVTIAGEERGVGYGMAKEERVAERGIAKEERTEERAKRLAKYRAGLKTPKEPKLPADWLKAPEKKETAIQKWITNWEKYIFTSMGKLGETGNFEDLGEQEKQTHFRTWAKRIPAYLRRIVGERVGMVTPMKKISEPLSDIPVEEATKPDISADWKETIFKPGGVTTPPPKLMEELREFDSYDKWYDSLSGADRGLLTTDEIETIKAWFANR